MNRGHGHPRPEVYQANPRSRIYSNRAHIIKRFVTVRTVLPDAVIAPAMTGLEMLLLILVLVLVLVAAQLIEVARPFIVNAVSGLVVLYLAQVVFGVGVAVTPLTVAIVAIGGVPGSLLVLALSLFGVAFVP